MTSKIFKNILFKKITLLKSDVVFLNKTVISGYLLTIKVRKWLESLHRIRGNVIMESIKNIFSNTEVMTLFLTGIGAMSLLFIKPVIDKFTQRFYPTSKSIQDIREIQLKEVYFPLYWNFRKYIGLPAKKLEIGQCRELYAKAYVKANKYPIYMEADIIDCIDELGRDIKRHDEDSIKDKYKRTSVKLLRNINIQ